MSLELRIEGLSKTYPNGTRALNDVSLAISTGMFGLLGPNGAGKSTLMRTLATLQEPDGGSARLGDIDVLTQKDQVRRVLGYLPQEFGVYPRVTALDLLDHLAVLKGLVEARSRKATVEALLHQTNLWEHRKQKLGTFSGGMKQRFGIAQALIGEPRLIIVDEPTAGLDPEERLRFHNLLAEIGENVIVILSTHIVEDVSDLCGHMAILAKGEVLATGRPGEAIRQLEGRVWRKAVTKVELEELRRSERVISDHLQAGQRYAHVLADAAPGPGFEPAPVGLEDVYFSTLKDAAGRRPAA